MGAVLVQLLPLALAAALSSVPISATIFILLSESRTRSGLVFLVGTVLGTFATVTLAAVSARRCPAARASTTSSSGRWRWWSAAPWCCWAW